MKRIICLVTSLLGLVASSGVQADNFYAGGFGGANWIQNNHHHQRTRTGYLLGLDAGYKWCNGLRAEFEFSYRNNRRHFNNNTDTSGSNRRHTNVYAGLVNVLYDFDDMGCWCLKPFVGAGIGAASERRHSRGNESTDTESGSSSRNRRKSSFCWQLIAGLGYPLNDCADLSLSYRFFKTSERLNNHGLALGLNYNF